MDSPTFTTTSLSSPRRRHSEEDTEDAMDCCGDDDATTPRQMSCTTTVVLMIPSTESPLTSPHVPTTTTIGPWNKPLVLLDDDSEAVNNNADDVYDDDGGSAVAAAMLPMEASCSWNDHFLFFEETVQQQPLLSTSNDTRDPQQQHQQQQRVSVDGTETWMTNDDNHPILHSHINTSLNDSSDERMMTNVEDHHSSVLAWMDCLDRNPILVAAAAAAGETGFEPTLHWSPTGSGNATTTTTADTPDAVACWASPSHFITNSSCFMDADDDEDCLGYDPHYQHFHNHHSQPEDCFEKMGDFLFSEKDNRWEKGTEATECSISVASEGALEEAMATLAYSIVDTTDTPSSSSSSSSSSSGTIPNGSKTSARQFDERRELLAASMRASHISRQCLHMKEHIQRRKVLQQVLEEIEQSTATVQQHCLQIIPPSSSILMSVTQLIPTMENNEVEDSTPTATDATLATEETAAITPANVSVKDGITKKGGMPDGLAVDTFIDIADTTLLASSNANHLLDSKKESAPDENNNTVGVIQ